MRPIIYMTHGTASHNPATDQLNSTFASLLRCAWLRNCGLCERVLPLAGVVRSGVADDYKLRRERKQVQQSTQWTAVVSAIQHP
jgi:coenzyme F420-reducing hydrogenase beta subunit